MVGRNRSKTERLSWNKTLLTWSFTYVIRKKSDVPTLLRTHKPNSPQAGDRSEMLLGHTHHTRSRSLTTSTLAVASRWRITGVGYFEALVSPAAPPNQKKRRETTSPVATRQFAFSRLLNVRASHPCSPRATPPSDSSPTHSAAAVRCWWW